MYLRKTITSMQRLTILLCCIYCTLAQNRSLHDFSMQEQKLCNLQLPELIAKGVDKKVLYNTAYAWSRQHEINNWNIESMVIPVHDRWHQKFDLPENMKMACQSMQYETKIGLPHVFHTMLPFDRVKPEIKSIMCNSGRNFFKIVDVSPLPIVGKVTLYEKYSLWPELQKISVFSNIEFDLPWYLSMFTSAMHSHIQKSLNHYTEIWSKNVCN